MIPTTIAVYDNEFLNSKTKLLPVVVSAFGILLSVKCSVLNHKLDILELRKLLTNKWYVDYSVNHGIVMPWE